ncbi:MAG TPA: hypothetical protein VFS44_14865 [Gemmatimonadaceae bacterium]|nr:hypothetical protein [Gemmatimonadaceae bacterium]
MTARTTPYEIILEPLEQTAFPAIAAEAEQRGVDARRRDQFLLLGHVGATLKDIVPDDAPPDALDEYGELLYQGYQFWTYGRRLYVLDDAVAERLTAPRLDLGDWRLAAPPACYIQLPYQRVWARVSAEAAFEPVDGCFAVVDDTAPAPDAGSHLRVQLILGFRRDRPGISLVSYRTDLDPRTAPRHAQAPWRENAPAFSNALPGGELRGLRSLVTTSELEALVLRTFHYLDTHPLALHLEPGSEREGETTLEHVLVRPDAGAASRNGAGEKDPA